MGIWKNLDDLLFKRLWHAEAGDDTGLRGLVERTLRFAYLIARDLARGELSLRAMSLVYTTMLSLVPLLAVTFSVLKAFGVHNQIEPLLFNVLAPLGAKASEVTQRVIGFVDNMRVGVLGSIGLVMLMYFVVSLVQKVEATLNYIWHIRRPRGIVQRFSEYLSVILVGPVLTFAAIGVTASVTSTTVFKRLMAFELIGTAAYFAGRLIPYILICAAFTFIYLFIPNTRVRFRSALVGGLVAGILWQTVGWLFTSFVASSAKYAAIYSGFAVLVLFMIWLYVSWYILLIGAQVSYYHQHPQLLNTRTGSRVLSEDVKERLGFLVMFLIGYNHYHNRPPWTAETLSSYLGLPTDSVYDVADGLVESGFLLHTGNEPLAYTPARDIETITLKALRDGLRGRDPDGTVVEGVLYAVAGLNEIMDMIDSAINDALEDQTVKSVVLGHNVLFERGVAEPTGVTTSTRKTA
ncbi:MAG: YhjD/YihY/BrkB family envelope integrity protein [Acidiferrobacterales bacterium]